MAGLGEWISENVLGVDPAGDLPTAMIDPFSGVAAAPRTALPGPTTFNPTGAGTGGRTITEVYTVFPNGVKQLRSVTPGGVKLYSRDVTAAKRTRKIGRLVNRLFPTRRRKARKR